MDKFKYTYFKFMVGNTLRLILYRDIDKYMNRKIHIDRYRITHNNQ